MMTHNDSRPQPVTEEDVDTVIRLLSQYSDYLKESVDRRYRGRRSLAMLGVVTSATLGIGSVFIALLFTLPALQNATGFPAATLVISTAIPTIILVSILLAVATIVNDERRRMRLVKRDIDTARRKLRRAIDLASALHEYKVESSVKRLELDLQLSEAEAILLYAGYDEYDLKAVNPHARAEADMRTPGELLNLIEVRGREVAEALTLLWE